MSPAASTRWCPTTEQLMILEEMYKGGIRTPNASQIQQITTHLSLFGKIKGKSVFYWFQNHKARDRQKLRRKLTRQQQQQQQKQTHSHYDSSHSHFLPQGGIEEASNQEMNYTWKVEISERDEMEKTMTRTYSRDWMMLMDEGPTPPCCCNRPLRTLELFPITTTSLKDECT